MDDYYLVNEQKTHYVHLKTNDKNEHYIHNWKSFDGEKNILLSLTGEKLLGFLHNNGFRHMKPEDLAFFLMS